MNIMNGINLYWRNYRKLVASSRLRILEVCGIILLVSLPLFAHGIAEGHDMNFHFMRIEGLAEELRRGIFPVRMSSSLIGGYGYPLSIFYGDILLYIPAFLRVMGVSMITAYKCYVLAINSGTVIIAYVCFGKMFKNDTVASLAALAYSTAGYRIVCLYVRSAAGEYTAMMFLPLVAFAVYRFYTLDAKNLKLCRRYALILALGMTGVITCHLASTTMVVATLVLVGVVLWKRTFTKGVLYGYALGALETVGLSAWFLFPFLDYFWLYYITPTLVNNGILQTTPGSAIDGIRALVFAGQAHGAYITQYFAFFQNIFGSSTIDLTARLALTPGLALMIVLVIALVDWVKGIATKEIKLLFCFSIFMLFMASDLFPWDYMWTQTLAGKVLAVQFPWRYLGIAIVFMTMLLGAVYGPIKKRRWLRKDFCILIAGACIVMSLFYVSNYSNDSKMRDDYDAEINTFAYMDGQYLRMDRKTPHSFTGEIVSKDMQQVELLTRNGAHMELYCEASDAGGTVELPILNYKGYRVQDEQGDLFEIEDGANNVVRIVIPPGFAGRILVDFVEPWYWRLGEAISLITVAALCVSAAMDTRRARARAPLAEQSGMGH